MTSRLGARAPVRRVCVMAHPDDDAIWFGNLEMLLGFDLKVVLTYRDTDVRARECLSWTQDVNPNCQVIFLGFPDVRHDDRECDTVSRVFGEHDLPQAVDELYVHGPAGEYGHSQHSLAHGAALSYFTPAKVIVPHYTTDGQGAQFTVGGGKFERLKQAYASQFNGLLKCLPNYCKTDYLDLFSG
jgi:LmbE family N-acetylglucosaminyl deacetylase